MPLVRFLDRLGEPLYLSSERVEMVRTSADEPGHSLIFLAGDNVAEVQGKIDDVVGTLEGLAAWQRRGRRAAP